MLDEAKSVNFIIWLIILICIWILYWKISVAVYIYIYIYIYIYKENCQMEKLYKSTLPLTMQISQWLMSFLSNIIRKSLFYKNHLTIFVFFPVHHYQTSIIVYLQKYLNHSNSLVGLALDCEMHCLLIESANSIMVLSL